MFVCDDLPFIACSKIPLQECDLTEHLVKFSILYWEYVKIMESNSYFPVDEIRVCEIFKGFYTFT